MRSLLRRAVFGLALACSTVPGQAQTVIHSTFGPGDAFNPFFAHSLGPTGAGGRQSVASSFTYSLAGPAGLDYFRVALASLDPAVPIDARFLAGSDINTATELESFSRVLFSPGFSPSIYTFTSLLRPVLTPGETYWIALSAAAPTPENAAWNFNNQGETGTWFRLTDDGSWFMNGSATPAFDVAAANAVPEPLSVVLLATGLAGVAAIRRRRGREGAGD